MADLKAKSRDAWRKLGYHVENGETILRVPGGLVRRQDVFGFADLIAVPPEPSEPIKAPRHFDEIMQMPAARDLLPDLPAAVLGAIRWTGTLASDYLTLKLPWIWIQSTGWRNVSQRLRKIQRETTGAGQWEIPIARLARAVLERGDLIVIEGWRKDPKDARGWYEKRERWITVDDLEAGE